MLGQPLTSGELWRTTRRALPRLIGASLLVTVACLAPVVLAGIVLGVLVALLGAVGGVIGGLLVAASLVAVPIVYVRLALSTCVLVLENAPVRTSFRRSWALVKGSSWRVFGVLVLTAVVGGFVAQVLQLPFVLFSGDGGPLSALSGGSSSGLGTRAVVLSTLGAGLASTIVAPFTAGVTALLYIDRRMRAEGLDVALQAAAAGRV